MPLKNGDIFLRMSISEIDEDMKIHLEVAFDEPGVGERKSIVETLQTTCARVGQIVTDLAPLIR
jgi:hypothetical protein